MIEFKLTLQLILEAGVFLILLCIWRVIEMFDNSIYGSDARSTRCLNEIESRDVQIKNAFGAFARITKVVNRMVQLAAKLAEPAGTKWVAIKLGLMSVPIVVIIAPVVAAIALLAACTSLYVTLRAR